ncbi:uncharacterized protein J3D65DRAFT_677291 [Phyllosticta citribraziliensis]|uniref:MYND-type domain-containing protein n=1 Tax=Phyllosticta citribraziliensis TaxID=989973 RepID=A0ABR1LQ43_9PEZI
MFPKRHARLRLYYNPLGNTPAVNLLRDLPKTVAAEPQPASVDVLSLEWGDPRSILFSLHAEGFDPQKRFNFTCCDSEPAIIARNIFLLTLIADGFDNCGPKDDMLALAWNVFFHICIPDGAMYFIQGKAEKLAEYSTSLEAWNSCPYGSWIRFLDTDSLSRVHTLWQEYTAAPMRDRYDPRGQHSLARLNRRSRDASFVVQSVRAAGLYAEQSVKTLSTALDAFWKTGVVGGNKRDLAQLWPTKGGLFNPLFAVKSAIDGEFTVPYGMDPLAGFHLAPAFEEEEGCDPEAVNRLVSTAKAQFRAWATTFGAYTKAKCVSFALQCGDAVNFCYALQALNPQVSEPPNFTYTYKNAWSAEPSQFFQDPAFVFDVIDTSNLADKVGMLNLLPAVVPLLRPECSSILYTESLLRADPEGNSLEMFTPLVEALCSDVSTIALFSGVVPVEYLTGISADSFVAETTLWEAFKQAQYRLRIPWRIMAVAEDYLFDKLKARTPTIEPSSLSDYLVRLYENMFKHETRCSGLSSLIAMADDFFAGVAGDQRYYTRTSFALLLNLFRSRVEVDWKATLSLFLEKQQEVDHESIGEHRILELQLQLHALGLLDNVLLNADPRDLGDEPFDMFPPHEKDVGLLGQSDVPSIVFLALVVPRCKFWWFTNDNFGQVVALPLHVAVSHTLGETNEFHSFQCFFGTLVQSEVVGICHVQENKAGWEGTGDLVVVCQVPLFTLLHGPREGLSVSLNFDPIPKTDYFIKKLGGKTTVFETSLADGAHLKVLREPPTTARDSDVTVPRRPSPSTGDRQLAKLDLYESQAIVMTVEQCFPHLSATAYAIMRRAEMELRVDTFFSVSVTLKSVGCDPIFVRFPHPIAPRSVKACYVNKHPKYGIKVVASLSYALVGLPLKGMLPFSRDPLGSLFLWVLPHVALHASPKFNLSERNADVLKAYARRAYSKQDSNKFHHWLNHGHSDHERPSPTTLLKVSVHGMLLSIAKDCAAGKPPLHIAGKTIHFVRPHKSVKEAHIALVITALRHDFSTGSVFLDAYAFPLARKEVTVARRAGGIKSFQATGCTMHTPSHEAIWHQCLIASAERCRSWTHRSDCRYGTSSPLGHPGTEAARNPYPSLCRCGEGLMLDDFPPDSPYASAKQFATRVAIPILFTVPYVDPIDVQGTSRWDDFARFFGDGLDLDGGDRCAGCWAKKEGLKKCMRCKQVKYCDVACQKKHWKEHKKVCHEQEVPE